MKKTIAAVLLATLLGGAGGYAWVAYQNRAVEAGLLSRLVTLEQQLSQTKTELARPYDLHRLPERHETGPIGADEVPGRQG